MKREGHGQITYMKYFIQPIDCENLTKQKCLVNEKNQLFNITPFMLYTEQLPLYFIKYKASDCKM